MRNFQKFDKKKFIVLIILFFSTGLLTLRSLKKVTIQDIKIEGSELFSKEDIVKHSSLNLPIRLIFIETKYVEKELKKNLSLENVSVVREILPFSLNVLVKTRTPIAYGERVFNNETILGFVDENGFFINKNYADTNNIEGLTIKIYGWQEKFRKTLSEILTYERMDIVDFVKISFSPNGFLTLEEKELKTILLGFNPNLVSTQLQIISNLKIKLKEQNFSEQIDNIDLIDPNNPKIKVFKP